jgi:hypothetical protein
MYCGSDFYWWKKSVSSTPGPGWLNELGLYELLGNPTTYHQYGVGSHPAL